MRAQKACACVCTQLGRVEEAIEAREWHRLLAHHDLRAEPARADAGVFEYRYWRWNGHLVRYAAAPPAFRESFFTILTTVLRAPGTAPRR